MDDHETRARARRHLQQGDDHQRAGRPGYAMQAYRQSIALHPTPEAYVHLGHVLSLIGRFEEAIEQCRQAIALDADQGHPYSDIGAYLVALGRWEEAEPWLEMALNAPHFEAPHLAHYHLGRVHQHFGRYEKAYAAYRAALAEEPGHDPSQEGLVAVVTRLN